MTAQSLRLEESEVTWLGPGGCLGGQLRELSTRPLFRLAGASEGRVQFVPAVSLLQEKRFAECKLGKFLPRKTTALKQLTGYC